MERLQAAQAPQHGNGHCCMLNNTLVFVIKKNPFQLADDNYEDAVNIRSIRLPIPASKRHQRTSTFDIALQKFFKISTAKQIWPDKKGIYGSGSLMRPIIQPHEAKLNK